MQQVPISGNSKPVMGGHVIGRTRNDVLCQMKWSVEALEINASLAKEIVM